MTDSSPGPSPIPVICDRCGASGMAGDEAFAAIPDILGFDPVQRRTHVNNWTAEHQRAFIAALAITGSPRRAARALGRHAFGAEQLRSARGGKSFAAAWDAALDLARDREFARIHANLSDLAARHAAEDATAPGSGGATFADGIADDAGAGARDYAEARQRMRLRLTRARRLLLLHICDDPARRAAWELLVGPADWGAAERLEAQPDEPFHDPAEEDQPLPSLRGPDMILVAEAGLIADPTGGHDTMADIAAALENAEAPSEDG